MLDLWLAFLILGWTHPATDIRGICVCDNVPSTVRPVLLNSHLIKRHQNLFVAIDYEGSLRRKDLLSLPPTDAAELGS